MNPKRRDVIPVKAGISVSPWRIAGNQIEIPAFAGMTRWIWSGCRKVQTLQTAGPMLM
jgi:hypothetical protein